MVGLEKSGGFVVCTVCESVSKFLFHGFGFEKFQAVIILIFFIKT